MQCTKLAEQFADHFEAYMDEMVYDFMFEAMMPALVPMVTVARGLDGKELSEEMEASITDSAMEISKDILNELVREQASRNYR